MRRPYLTDLTDAEWECSKGLLPTSDASGNGSPAIIRLATERDAEQIAALYAPNVTDTVISFESEPPSADEMRRRIEVTLERYPWLVCERQGRVLGYAYAGAHGSRASTTPTPGPRCQTRRASGCTRRWVFGPSGSTGGSATSWALGMTWCGGTSRYANG
jgi:GNAT acetyltransferase-like protein